jgi:hypothetical protein
MQPSVSRLLSSPSGFLSPAVSARTPSSSSNTTPVVNTPVVNTPVVNTPPAKTIPICSGTSSGNGTNEVCECSGSLKSSFVNNVITYWCELPK